MARLLDIYNDVAFRLNKEKSTPTFTAYIKREISNAAIQHCNVEHNWHELRRTDTITTSANVEDYNLPLDCKKVITMWHQIDDSRIEIPFTNAKSFYKGQLSTTETGRPQNAVQNYTEGVLAQPSSASTITAVSSVTGDESLTFKIFGIVSGYPDTETITLNSSASTTSVTGSKSFSRIDRIAKDSSTTGRVTFTSNSGGVTNAVFPVGLTSNHLIFKAMTLYPIPDAAYLLYFNYYAWQTELKNDTDITVMTPDHDEAIKLLTMFMVDRSDSIKRDYNVVVRKLIDMERSNPAITEVMQGLPGNSYHGRPVPYGGFYEGQFGL